jgi:EPS-associated MarR family transcriptional regulator
MSTGHTHKIETRACSNAHPAVACLMTEERELSALRLLEQNPEMTQRALAEALGVSVGAANYCLKALVEKGWVKLENFQKNPNKLGYLYLLTPQGLAAKSQLTARFLKRKLNEYTMLREEIEELQAEVKGASSPKG